MIAEGARGTRPKILVAIMKVVREMRRRRRRKMWKKRAELMSEDVTYGVWWSST